MPTQKHRNGQGDDRPDQIRDELDIQGRILESSDSNPLLRETNLGLGHYDEDYKWQQIRSYRKGLYAWIAFGRALSQRQIYETKIKLGDEGFNAIYDDLDNDVRQFRPFDESDAAVDDDQSRWSAVRERGERIWKRLGAPDKIITDEQLAAIHDKTGISEEWKPIFWELVSGRHEVSRSEDAELLRDALTGVKELREQGDEEESLL